MPFHGCGIVDDKDDRITYMPVYMAMFLLPGKLPEKMIYRV